MPAPFSFFSHAHIIEHGVGGFSRIIDGMDDEARTSYHITTRKDFRIAGLEGVFLFFLASDTTTVINADTMIGKPRRWAGLKTKSDNHRVTRNNLLRSWNNFRHTTT